MNEDAGLLGTGLAALLFALPLGIVTAIAGVRSWIGLLSVSLILITIATLLFSNPHHTRDDFLLTGAWATFGVLVDGLLIRAGLRAISRMWKRRGGRSVART